MKRRDLAAQLVNLGAQLAVNVRSTGQDEEDGAEQTRGRIPPRQEDLQTLGADLDRVLGRLDELVEKDIGASFPRIHLFLLEPLPIRQSFLHILIDKVLTLFDIRRHGPSVLEHLRHDPTPADLPRRFLRVHKGLGKVRPGLRVTVPVETTRGFAKEELRRDVHCQIEEEILQIDGGAVARNGLDQFGDVHFEQVQIGNVLAVKIGPEQRTRSGPGFTVGGEDAVSEQGHKRTLAPIGHAPIIKTTGRFFAQDTFHILRFDGEANLGEEDSAVPSITVAAEAVQEAIAQRLRLETGHVLHDHLEADQVVGEAVHFGVQLDGLTAILGDDVALEEIPADAGVDVIDDGAEGDGRGQFDQV